MRTKTFSKFKILSFSLALSALFADRVFSEDLTKEESSESVSSAKQKDWPEMPTWLTKKSFRIRQRLELILDGSERAGSISQKSESVDQLVFLNPGEWRLRRELPFTLVSREILQSKEGSYIMTRTNRRVAPLKPIDSNSWIELMLLPYQMSQRWAFVDNGTSWNSWFEKIQKLEADFKTAENDTIKVKKTTEAGVEKMSVMMEGSFIHDGKTEVRTRLEWTFESAPQLNPNDLQKSLAGGQS